MTEPTRGRSEIRIDDQIFFGITSAVGTPIDLSVNVLRDELAAKGYEWQSHRLSELSQLLKLSTPTPAVGSDEYRRITFLMERGNDARKVSTQNAILAMLAIQEAAQRRSERQGVGPQTAVLFRQLKHPDEAFQLRDVYDEGFHLVGVHCPRSIRLQQLQVQRGLSSTEAEELVRIDEFQGLSYGQRVRDTFHHSDVFVRATGDAVDATLVRAQLTRFVDLLFGAGFFTPTVDEYGMFLAWTSGLRSAQLARQVGAAILTPQGEVLALGANEVPRAGGGQYWEGQNQDGRDHTRMEGDSSDHMEREMLAEILDVMEPGWRSAVERSAEGRLSELQVALREARITNLTEFTRAVHAEMEAISSAVRVGVSVRGATLYTTTFPCHNCTKHIVAAGVARVVYMAPYPKSLAYDLHKDALVVDEPRKSCGDGVPIDGRVSFEAFVGIAPRRYADLFSMTTKDGRIIRRKDALGHPQPKPGLRLRLQVGSYQTREDLVAAEVARMTSLGGTRNE